MKLPEGMQSAREFTCTSAVCNRPVGHTQHSTRCEALTLAVEIRDGTWAEQAEAGDLRWSAALEREAWVLAEVQKERDAAREQRDAANAALISAQRAIAERDARIAKLETALRVQAEVWQSFRDRIAEARKSREGSRGGQHAGVPEFLSWPPSATTTVDREASFSLDQITVALETP